MPPTPGRWEPEVPNERPQAPRPNTASRSPAPIQEDDLIPNANVDCLRAGGQGVDKPALQVSDSTPGEGPG